MRFIKIQANGNDFICLDNMNKHISLDTKTIQRMCHRHFGVGSDGILMMEKSETSDLFMRVFNLDGSEASLCGNGLFCISECWRELTGKLPHSIETLSGLKKLVYDDEGLWINMGKGEINQLERGIKVNVGNNHLVLFEKYLDDEEVERVGKYYQRVYEDGINVEFCHILSKNEVEVKIYERGVGKSLSCGSGACAVFLACKHLNPTLRKLYVFSDGGTLCVKEIEEELYLHSKAKIIYRGEYDDESGNY